MVKKRGRPIGFKLSDETKRAISLSKQGQKHSEETKEKISKSLISYFRKKKPVSEEIINMYCRSDDDDICDWIICSSQKIDDSDEIKTFRSILNAERYEGTFNFDIERISHSMTPEVLVLFKDYCEENDIDMEYMFDEITKG